MSKRIKSIQLRELYTEIHTEARKIGLEVNEEKTKYMVMSTDARKRDVNSLNIENNNFESVNSFIYLGAEVNSSNLVTAEIQRRLMAGQRAFYANLQLIK